MSETSVDSSKRRFLVTMSSALGGVAALGVAVPFVFSMNPSARAKAAGAPVEVDLTKVEPGMLLAVEWRGKPVWVVNRTKDMLDMLAKHDDKLTDPGSETSSQQPEYCKNPTRSIKPEYLIVVGICTHLGCSPTFRKEVAPADLGADWPGG
ncbi:MAG TPA: ubiquinol-cytochrome c reductase iron-sulfur subunit, partial [Thiobacillaceae bacterium]|nr:ubiquinol-cytochrome c reductase iron-sulfur subunit [Thiobacillaceae bacterium]